MAEKISLATNEHHELTLILIHGESLVNIYEREKETRQIGFRGNQESDS